MRTEAETFMLRAFKELVQKIDYRLELLIGKISESERGILEAIKEGSRNVIQHARKLMEKEEAD